MSAQRLTVLVDACSLVPPLTRNVMLSLAEGDLFRLRWSAAILAEVERAIATSFAKKGVLDGDERAAKACAAMERAFEDANVIGFEALIPTLGCLPDPGDAHVIAAAVKTRASLIVTENLRHFPKRVLMPFDLEAKRADTFIAEAVEIDPDRAVLAIRRMRERFRRPEMTAKILLQKMEQSGLMQTAAALRNHGSSL